MFKSMRQDAAIVKLNANAFHVMGCDPRQDGTVGPDWGNHFTRVNSGLWCNP